jgi:hypothetical protein
MRIIAVCGAIVATGLTMHAQTHLLEKVRLNDATTSKGITIDKPSGMSSGQELNFPSSAGAVDQVLGISNVTGTSIDMGWTSAGASSTTTSDRLSSVETVTFGDTATGATVSASANKNYRVSGVLRGNRLNSGGSPSDNLSVMLLGPVNTTYTMIGIRCTGCPAGTTGLPTALGASGASVTTSVFNPAGATDNFAPVTICFEGLIKIGNTPGSVSVSFVDDGSGSNGLEMLSNSYLLLTEVE